MRLFFLVGWRNNAAAEPNGISHPFYFQRSKDVATVAYPNELTQAHWDKKKPLLAKKKPTGIGDALKTLKKAHDAIRWDNFTANGAIVAVDEALERLPKEFAKDVKPIADMAKDVEKLAKKWAADFTKDKLIPKSGAAAATAVADAAKKYASDLLDMEGELAKDLVAQRKELSSNIRKTLKPVWTKTAKKIDGLLKDILAFGRNPTEENYWSLFSGDCNARGYTTGCKNWDQQLSEFPELRDQCYKGNAMDTFFPGMQDYGANYDKSKFDAQVNSKTGKTGDDRYRWHALKMVKEAPNIKKFQAAIDKLLKLLDA
jgi:hypothetical protein